MATSCTIGAIIYFLWIRTSISSELIINVNFSDITNSQINRNLFGMNMWTGSGKDTNYTAPYTIIRNGGNYQSTFDFANNVYNRDDWYWLSVHPPLTWQEYYDAAINQRMNLLVQIPAMGWVGKLNPNNNNDTWSFSQNKYGKQEKDECDSQPTDCFEDAGNGIWSNGSDVIGNDPNDAQKPTLPTDAANYVKAIVSRYGINNQQIGYFEIDNEPNLWGSGHRDVHPQPTTYDEIWNKTYLYAKAVKNAYGDWNKCKVISPSSCCWCSYFTSAADQGREGKGHHIYCYTGPDRTAHGNLTLLQYIMYKAAQYEKQNGKPLVDYIDIHYYPSAIKNGSQIRGCTEDPKGCYNRLQAPRSLWDWTYIDPGYNSAESPFAIIPRIQGWINNYNPSMKLSVSEYVFGGTTCLTSIIAHAEALAIYAKYGVALATRWSKPPPDSLLDISWNVFLNFDYKNTSSSSILDLSGQISTLSLNTSSTNVTTCTAYAFIKGGKTMYIYLFNKETTTTDVTVQLLNNNNGNFNTKGDIQLYGIDNSTNSGPFLHYIGTVDNKPSEQSFAVTMPFYTVRLAVIEAK